MERHRRPKPGPGTFSVEAAAAFRAVAAADDPWLLGYYPAFHTNPYQALLYGAAWEHGIAPVRMFRAAQLDELAALQRSGLPTVLHLHWLHLVQRDAISDGDARSLGRAFLASLDAYRAEGGRVVWTVHNILPHETRYEAAEIALVNGVIERSDVVHVLTAGTPELVAPWYSIPADKVLHVPHPSYRGAYADFVSRQDARHELGLGGDELVFLALGAIRPYKGLDELLDAWRESRPVGPARLVIAGDPADRPGIEELMERAAVEPTVLVDARQIPPDEMQHFLRAADVAVLPYRRALNSGALMLALTFGLPVIVPGDGGLAEIVEPSFAATFTPGDAGSLAAALRRAPELATDDACAAAAAVAARHDPRELSSRFAAELRARLAAAPAAATRA
ncbi:MAG TPA: glycosyltransferase [Candidatus Binatia bacterium]|nr:glycosyltransferase [Candidatus Binatia bacterium]